MLGFKASGFEGFRVFSGLGFLGFRASGFRATGL